MAATPPSNQKPSDRTPTGESVVPLTFDEKLNQFWQKNRTVVLGVCGLILVAILGKGVWERIEAGKEKDVQAAYAESGTPDQLRAFISSHPDHALAGIAELRLADQAYAAGKISDAAANYDKALTMLKEQALIGRAKLGRALSNLQSGKVTEGESQLKQIANDANEFKALRAEAAYQLASAAVEAHNAADAQTYIALLNQIDPTSVWARRAVALQANLPVSSAPQPGTPSVQVNAPKK